MTCLGVLDRGEQDDGNETGLKEGRGIEMSTTVLHSRCSLLRLNTYLQDDHTFLQNEKRYHETWPSSF